MKSSTVGVASHFFLAADINFILALERGEGGISGWTNKRLQAVPGGLLNAGQVSRMLKLKEYLIIPALKASNPQPA